MNKVLHIALLFLICHYANGQSNKVIVNGQEFNFVQTAFNDTLQAEFIEVYRNDNQLIKHTLSHSDGDCSSINVELGTYEVIDNNIIFYSYWASGDRMMKNIYPFGFRKQTYVVTDDGRVSQISSIVYIEDYVDAYKEHKGMEYLNKVTVTDAENKLLKDYVSKAEKMYFGNFVYGEAKARLEKEVREKLKSEINGETKNWKEVYGDHCNK